MENKQNLHTHTTYVDEKDTPEEMILTAIEKGFDSIGFSEHAMVKYSVLPNKLTLDAMERYKAEIRSLKEKYRGVWIFSVDWNMISIPTFPPTDWIT